MSEYDASAIAKLMGLAFVQPSKRVSTRSEPKSAGKIGIIAREGVGFVELVASGRRGAEIAPSPVHIELAIEAGLPRNSLKNVVEAIAGDDPAKVSALEWDIVPKTTLERRKGLKLTLEESERTERVARLFVHARKALGSNGEAREFMTAPHPELDRRTPFEIAKTDLGARRVERLLNALEYGLAV